MDASLIRQWYSSAQTNPEDGHALDSALQHVWVAIEILIFAEKASYAVIESIFGRPGTVGSRFELMQGSIERRLNVEQPHSPPVIFDSGAGLGCHREAPDRKSVV